MSKGKTNPGNFFEDFEVGQTIRHATPRTVTHGDVAVYASLYGARQAVTSSEPFATALGFETAPIDDFLVFHIVFGKTVPEISLNAVANLGYAECVFRAPVYPGDTLSAESEVIGLKENSSGKTGVVYVRSKGFNQHGACVLSYARWVMVNKRDRGAPPPEAQVPDLAAVVGPSDFADTAAGITFRAYDFTLAGARHRFGDYEVGERIDHADGVTIEEAEHQSAARLYQNTAKVHFNDFEQKASRFGRRLIYGGVVISLTRALSYNGLENAQRVLALNAGQHVAPTFAGDTIFAWSEILEKEDIPNRDDCGALRVRTYALKNQASVTFSGKQDAQGYDPSVVLDLDYWVLLPR